MLTLADMQYGKYTMKPLEIVYNIVSFLVAITITIAFTVYARRALNDLKEAESSNSEGIHTNHNLMELDKLPWERPWSCSLPITDVWYRSIVEVYNYLACNIKRFTLLKIGKKKINRLTNTIVSGIICADDYSVQFCLLISWFIGILYNVCFLLFISFLYKCAFFCLSTFCTNVYAFFHLHDEIHFPVNVSQWRRNIWIIGNRIGRCWWTVVKSRCLIVYQWHSMVVTALPW